MSETITDTKLATLTPEQQGAFFSLVKQQTPSWVLESSTEVRTALRKSLMASYLTRAAVVAALREWKSPEKFCGPLLTKAMSDKLRTTVAIEGVIFQHIRSTSSLLGLRKKLVTPIDRDLLMAACENFESSETKASNYNDYSLIYVPAKINGGSSKVLPIKPDEFAQLCRTLDLGKQYQNHIKALFEANQLRDKYVAFAKDKFEVEMQIALMKKHISGDVYTLLKSVKEGATSIKLGSNTLGYQGLEMLGVKVQGVVFVGPVSEHKDGDFRCVVYLPGDPLHPLKEYASFKNFETELSKRLRDADFRTFFMRFILLKDRPGFLAALNTRLLSPSTASPLPKDSVYVSVEGFDLKDDVFKAMYNQRSAQVIADARLLVVPTDDEDEKTRLDRLETYKTIGLNTLLFFSSFVPVVGEVMFAVAGIQLLTEVYEGIESWTQGEQEQATDYLFDVIENLILMAASAAAGGAVSKGFGAVKSSDFIGQLRTVPVRAGSTRLWKPDLKDYRQFAPLPRKLPVDEQGLVKWRDQQYLRTGMDTYAVRPMQGTGLWEIEHPVVPERYSPVLETNGAGAWRHDSELPQNWDLLTLFRRLGFREEDISDREGSQILASSGIDEQLLRRLYLDRSKPMATLVDTARRFRADKAVNRFIEQMLVPATAPQADADLQLHLLTCASKWPKDASVSITRLGGGEARLYGPASASRKVKVPQALLDKGQFYPALLSALSAKERTHLLGSTTADQTLQAQALSKAIAEQTELNKLALSTRVYQRSDVITQTLATPVQAAFAELPASVADELVQHADVSEVAELEDGKVPLRLAEEVRRYTQVVRLNRAFEGLYLDAAHGLDGDRLVLNTLKHLPGWPNDVYVQIREWAVPSEQKAGIGSSDAAHKVFIDAYADRFKASDADDTVLSTHLKRTREHFFKTLLEGLPAHARKQLGVEANDAGVALRKKITTLALQRRSAIAQAIGIDVLRTGYRSPMGLADRLVEKTTLLGLPPTSLAGTHPPEVMQRAQELYPTHPKEQIERFLTTLGTDKVLTIRALERLRLELQTLRYALEHWVHRDTHYQEGDGPRLKVPKASKDQAAQTILRAWRKEAELMPDTPEILYNLKFEAQPLGDLPAIVGDFGHIGTLEMDKVGASAGLKTFLRNFTNLRTLSLTGNQLTRIPQAIETMPRLRHLDLSDNQIYLTPESTKLLSERDQLHSLDLSFNRTLGRSPSVNALLQLRHLALRDTGIVDWPIGVNDLAELQRLDLRDNLIAHIPEAVFTARVALNRGTNVDGNPLSPTSLQRITAYQRSSGINLGVHAADYRLAAFVQPDLARHGSIWMSHVSGTELATKQTLWNSLAAYPRSRDFFHLLARLHDSADFNLLQIDLSRRVWDVLDAAGEDDALRRALFQMARIGRSGAEDASALFSDIEVRVLCFRAVLAARIADRTLEGELVRLMRGLFRLQEVERLARIEIGRRTLSGPFSHAQAQELGLLYRVRLAERLELPAQPREINNVLDVEVSTKELDDAYRAVVNAESTESLLASIHNRGFWYEYLVATYPGEFSAVTQRSAQALGQLESQAGLTRATATQRTKAIIDNFKNEIVLLVKRLTSAALARHPGPTLPAEEIPES